MKASPRRFALLAVGLAILLVGVGQAGATVYGLSDQAAGNLSDSRFVRLPIEHVRLVVPWNVAYSDPASVDAWLAAAHDRGLVALVAFEHSTTDKCPDSPCYLPSPAQLRDAFEAFRTRWPEVHEFTSWNEPNHPSQPVALQPAAAAGLYDALVRACPKCTFTAGDTVDTANMKSWIRDYRAALETVPSVWSIHNYGDVTYDRASYTGWLENLVAAPVWVTETGGIVSFARDDGEILIPYDESRARASTQKALDMAAQNAWIERMYFYQWRARPWDLFDAGLLRPDGTARPALDAVAAALGPRLRDVLPSPSDVPPSDGPNESVPGPPVPGVASEPRSAAVAILPGPAPKAKRGGIDVVVRCPRRHSSCRGRITLSAVGRTGRSTPIASRAFAIHGTGKARVHLRLSAARLRKLRTSRSGDLLVTVRTWRPRTFVERKWALPLIR